MTILLIILLSGLSLIIYPNYNVAYAGQELILYKIGVILGIFSIFGLLLLFKDKLNKARITSASTILYDLLNMILVLLIIFLVGIFIVYLYRINKFTGEVYTYGKLCIKKIYDISEKTEWLESLKNAINIPTDILEKAKINLNSISSQEDLLNFVKLNLKDKEANLITQNEHLASRIWNEATTNFHVISSHIMQHPYLYGGGVIVIIILYYWSSIWGFVTGPSEEFGKTLKETIQSIGSGFDASNKQVDCLAQVQTEVLHVSNLVSNFSKASVNLDTNVSEQIHNINSAINAIVSKLGGLEQTLLSNKAALDSLIAAQEGVLALIAM